MQFTIPLKELKPRGYTFQKLYAANYRTYRKEFGEYGEYTIWLWEKDKQIEIDSWYGNTEKIINYYKENINSHLEKTKNDSGEMKKYLRGWLNRKTGDIDPYLKHVDYSKMKLRPEGDKWSELVLYIPIFEDVIKEINFITK